MVWHGGGRFLAIILFVAAALALATEPSPVAKAKSSPTASGRTRIYYIAADDVQWNYAPKGRNLTGLPSPENEGASPSTTFRKAVYHEYQDASFNSIKPRPPEWEHLGILGPLIRAEVGDTIRVVFKNNTKFFCGMHPHGLAYTKEFEGAVYADGTSTESRKGGGIPPGQVFTYTWTVPERAGPASGDTTSILWVYHSHFVEPRDMNTGLFGPILITARGASRVDGTPKDVDREFVTSFAVFDETESWYFQSNVMNRREYAQGLRFTDPAFRRQFLLYSINGLIEGNLPAMTMKRGEKVRWYLFANGNEDDVHTPHWHGQTVTFNNMRTDMVHLEPMMMVSADMVPDNPGTWLFHCHVSDHIEGGMQSLFTVLP